MMYRVRGVFPSEQGILAYILESNNEGLFEGSAGVVRSVYNNGGREGSAAAELVVTQIPYQQFWEPEVE